MRRVWLVSGDHVVKTHLGSSEEDLKKRRPADEGSFVSP